MERTSLHQGSRRESAASADLPDAALPPLYRLLAV